MGSIKLATINNIRGKPLRLIELKALSSRISLLLQEEGVYAEKVYINDKLDFAVR